MVNLLYLQQINFNRFGKNFCSSNLQPINICYNLYIQVKGGFKYGTKKMVAR